MSVELVREALVIGAGATLVMDAWVALRQRWFGSPGLDYGWVTRWLRHLSTGVWRVHPKSETPPSLWEQALGWVIHYVIGVGYAGAMLAVTGFEWVASPTLAPAVLTGLVTLGAPFMILQPALGAGLFAVNTPNRWAARAQTVLNHLVFGLGLYLSALVRAQF